MPAVFPDGLPAIMPATVAQVQRRLPAAGEIKVRMGSRVEPDDLIGQCSVSRVPLLLDIAGALGVQPREFVRRFKPSVGSHVAFRDLLARRGRRLVLAPTNGTITEIDGSTGFVILTPDPEPASVTAMVKGYVAALEPQRSVLIETAAAVVQGMVGGGGDQWGLLRLLVTDPSDVVTADLIDARSAFSIVIGGAGITAEALRKAQAEQVKGVILGGIEASELRDYLGPYATGGWQAGLSNGTLLPAALDTPTLLVTEGFGTCRMNEAIWHALTRFDRHEALLQGTTRLLPPRQRPRLVVPLSRLPGGQATPPPDPTVEEGVVVRIIADAYCGKMGKVIATHARGRLPSGIRTATATVQLADQRVVLPVSVLHVIERATA